MRETWISETGKLVLSFGKEGIVEMKPGALNSLSNSSFGLSSPPVVYKNVIITGAPVQEMPGTGAAGDTRAWDTRTGKLLSDFHSIPRAGEPGSETREGDSWKNRSGTNVWGFFTLDATRGIVYMPFGEPTSDYWGGDRKGANLYGTSLVAVDALTGKMKWYFQGVHHDTWDYDFAASPVLFDVTRNGKKISAVARLTKMGFLFVLSRETDKPIFGIEERPVPVSDALPGDSPSATQPFPLKPPPLARTSFKREDLATVTPELQKYCQDLFDSLPGGLHRAEGRSHITRRNRALSFPVPSEAATGTHLHSTPRLATFSSTQWTSAASTRW
jgi:quinoprotein glucose dehydrogenase